MAVGNLQNQSDSSLPQKDREMVRNSSPELGRSVPGFSPTMPASKMASMMKGGPGPAKPPSKAQLLQQIQKGFGNEYAQKVIAGYRNLPDTKAASRPGPSVPAKPPETAHAEGEDGPVPHPGAIIKLLAKAEDGGPGKPGTPVSREIPPKSALPGAGKNVLGNAKESTRKAKEPPAAKPVSSVTPSAQGKSAFGPEPIPEGKPGGAGEAAAAATEKGTATGKAGGGGAKSGKAAKAGKAGKVEAKKEDKKKAKAEHMQASGGGGGGAAAGGGGGGGGGGKSPSSPEEDTEFQKVKQKAGAVATKEAAHAPASVKAGEAQGAASGPAGEVAAGAKAKQAGEMDAQQPKPFDRAAFKSALLEKIASLTPKNLEEADEFKDSGKLDKMKGEVTSKVTEGKDDSQGAIKEKTAAAPDPAGIQPKTVTPMPPNEAGPPPGGIGGEKAAPKVKTESEISLQEGSKKLDKEMDDAQISESQLEKSNEPDFKKTVADKREAKKDAVERPVAYRHEEADELAQNREQAAGVAKTQVQSMHGTKVGSFGKVGNKQEETKSKDEQARLAVTTHIQEIFDRSKAKVEARLASLDTEVNQAFDQGSSAANASFEAYVDQRMSRYKDDRYGGFGGGLLWAKDKLFGMPDEVNVFYTEGRDLYMAAMDAVIDKVAMLVEKGLGEAKQAIIDGKQEIATYVEGLPTGLQELGKQKADEMQSEFDGLEQSIQDKQGALVDSLAQKYVDNLKKLDERIDAMKAANKGLVDAVIGAIKAIIKVILQLKNMLLNVLARAAAAIGKIISDPIGFLGNLVSAVKQGIQGFLANIGKYLQEGLMGWLFGELGSAGIKMPASFDLQGILGLVMQILGLTYANVRSRAVIILGETVVVALETAAEIFKILITEGPAGVWNYMAEKLGDIKETIIGGIKDFVIQKIVVAGITWLLSMLNPASAFIKACKMIYDVVMFFVTRGSQIMALVNAVIDSVTAIAAGALGAAAAAVEGALAKALPVAISFLASLLGLGGIGEKIKAIIEKIRKPINTAIDWVINKAYTLVKSLGKLLFGGKKKKGDESTTEDPKHDAKVQAGLAALDQEEEKLKEDGEITQEQAQQAAAKVKAAHPVFKSIQVVDGKDSWDFKYTASPPKLKKGEKKGKHDSVNSKDIWDAIVVNWAAKNEAQTKLSPSSASASKATLLKMIVKSGAPADKQAAAASVVEIKVNQALAATNGDKIYKLLLQGQGVVNALLREYGVNVSLQTHHQQRVTDFPDTFVQTKRGRLYIPKAYQNSVDQWVKEMMKQKPKPKNSEIKAKREEIIGLLRDQMMDDKRVHLGGALEEVDMVVLDLGAHITIHRNE